MAQVVYEIPVLCPKCSGARTPVQRTGKKYRRRKCLDCDERFLTVRVTKIPVTCSACGAVQNLADFRMGQTVAH